MKVLPAAGLTALFVVAGSCIPSRTASPPARPDVESHEPEAKAQVVEEPEVGGDEKAGPDNEAVRDRRRLRMGASDKLRYLERVPEIDEKPVTGEVPSELSERIVSDLARKLAVEPQAIEILHAEVVTWNDGSLGCPEPGQVYTQAPVPGYRLVLVHGGRRYDYHASAKGTFVLCRQPTLGRPASGAVGEPPKG